MQQWVFRLDQQNSDLLHLKVNPVKFGRIGNSTETYQAYQDVETAISKWTPRVKRYSEALSEDAVRPLLTLLDQVIALLDRNQTAPGETLPSALRRMKGQFETNLSTLAFALVDASGFLDTPEALEKTKRDAEEAIKSNAATASNDLDKLAENLLIQIRTTADEAVKDYEKAKEDSSRIVVKKVQEQFYDAKRELRNRAWLWAVITLGSFGALIWILFWLFSHPPTVIEFIENAIGPNSTSKPLPVSIPLLLAASAYFTAIRLALVGIVAVALSVSIRMLRAYLHMIEHNSHRLRVTNSMEAFVAAVRTKEQKDLILGKLVESVTEFGESGILGAGSDNSGLSPVIIDAITKNIGKSD